MKITQIRTVAFMTTSAVIGLTTFAVAAGVFSIGNGRILGAFILGAFAPSRPRWEPLPVYVPGKTPTAQQVVRRCQRAYDALKTYQISVSVTTRGRVGPAQLSIISHTSASIQFARPGNIHAEAENSTLGMTALAGTYAYVSNGLVTYLRDSDTGNSWQKAQSADFAIASYQGVADAAISALPAVLLGTQTYNPFSRGLAYSPVVQQGTLDGTACYLVTGTSAVPTMKITEAFYIDKKTCLLKRLMTDLSGTVNAGAGSVAVNSHSDQVYMDEKINAPIPARVFLTPPIR